MLIWLGLFGLVASFHGIILGYSRQIYALGREGYLPAWLAKLHPRFRTPHRAILAGGVVGIIAIFSDQYVQFAGQALTANIVTMSVFGAIVMYIISILSLFAEENGAWLASPVPRAVVSLFPRVFPGGGHRLSGDDDLL